MSTIRYYKRDSLPLEMHKVRIVQKLNLPTLEERLANVAEAGNNTFLLNNRDVFLDMLTDSGVNAMSDRQEAAMCIADDSYAGSETFVRHEKKLKELFGMPYVLPFHQGRACENLLAQVMVKPGTVVPMNYHFTTTKAHIMLQGGSIEELITDKGLEVTSTEPFKGNMDPDKLKDVIKTWGVDNVAFVRMEAGTNLIGGQPFSMANLKEISGICKDKGLTLVMDISLLADNLYFIKTREDEYKDKSIREITMEMVNLCDIVYYSARKLGCARGGGMCMKDGEIYEKFKELIPLYEGFLTYGGMSVREIEAITVGLEETMDENMINQAPQFIEYMVNELAKRNVPVVTPAGGLGCHIDAMRFVDHIPQNEYPAGALASALYIISGIRGMERGTISEQRQEDGTETLANVELLRLALPRRVFTLSQVEYAIDRINWLYDNRHLVGGLTFTEEPKILRFFFGKLKPVSDWQERLAAKFKEDFGDSL
jgi:tryptophanase